MQTWKQTFRAVDGTVLSGAAVSVYLAGTTTAARVFDVNDVLYDTAPQLTTDAAGFIEFSFDEDDFSTGQLFDVKVTCNFLCNDLEDVDLRSIKLLQDTEGGLEFKKTFIQSEAPTDSTLHEGDLWFDTDDSKTYVYTDGAWAEVSGGAGTPGENGVDAGNWSSTIVFSATDYNTVAWTTGDVITGTAPTTYSISSTSNTGSMTAATAYYIYFSPDDSETALQSSTTAADAVGAGKILMAVAFPNSDTAVKAQFQAFGGRGGVFINADNIAANCIAADKIVANSLTSSEISAATLTISNLIGAGALAEEDTITNAFVTSIDGGKITTGTVLASRIQVGSIVITSLSGASTFTSYDTDRVNGTTASTVVTGASNGTTAKTKVDSWDHASNSTKIDGGKIYTDSILAASMHADAISTCRFKCTTSSTIAYSVYLNYTEANSSATQVALGAVNKYTGYSVGLYGKSDGNSTSYGVQGSCTNGTGVYGLGATGVLGSSSSGNGVKGVSSTSLGVYGYSSSSQGVSGYSVSNYGVYGATGGTYGLYTPDYAYTINGVVPFTGTHIGFSKQKLIIGDIANSEGSLLLGISEGMPFLATTIKPSDKAVAGIISRTANNTDILASEELCGLVDDSRFFDKEPINEKIITEPEDDPERGVKKGDTYKTNDGYNYKMKPVPAETLAKDAHPTTLQGVIDSDEYYVTFINALGEGGINVCKEGGNIEIGDYICSSSIPGKGMKQSDDLLHNYTVAKSLVNVTWKASETDIRMIACTYHCG